ncbi:MAG: hypothetical protein ACI9FN_003656, partial [Saprospiraceae bacterium]
YSIGLSPIEFILKISFPKSISNYRRMKIQHH